jgi:hypothetical protein
VAFRIGDILGAANVKNFFESTAKVSVLEVAEVYARNINYPVWSCQITKVFAQADEPWPTFNFLANGFYPNEPVIVQVDGMVEFGGEAYWIANFNGVSEEMSAVRVFSEWIYYPDFEWFGINRDPLKVDNTGRIYSTIIQTGVETEDEVIYFDQHQITIYGLYSGCSISAPAVWESSD